MRVEYINNNQKSEFFNELVKREVKEILEIDQKQEDTISLNKKYVYIDDENLELGVYITNTSKNDIKVERLPIKLLNDGKIIFNKGYNFDIEIKAETSIPVEIKISLDDLRININDIENVKNIEIELHSYSTIKKEKCFEIDVKELDYMEYKVLKKLKKFVKKLENIPVGRIAVDAYGIDYYCGKISLVIFIRNSSNKTFELGSLPIRVYDESELLVYSKVVSFEDEKVSIKPNSGMFHVIDINEELPKNIIRLDGDYSDFTIKFE